MTFTQFYEQWADEMEEFRYLNFKSDLPYSLFIRSWYCYLDLLEIDWREGFLCSKCGTNPSPVICDGTDHGFMKKFLPLIDSVTKGTTISRIR